MRLRDWILATATVGVVSLCTYQAAAITRRHAGFAEVSRQDAPPTPGAPPAKRAPGYRWAVKTASDPDVSKVDSTPRPSSVEQLLALPRPDDMPIDGSNTTYLTHRASPVETTVYAVEADVTAYRLAADGDVHVTIRGASGKTLALEMPDAAAVDRKSPFYGKIKAVRTQFEHKFQVGTAEQQVVSHVRLSGIGFFNRKTATGSATGNLIQLHPVVSISWLKKPTKEFASSAGK